MTVYTTSAHQKNTNRRLMMVAMLIVGLAIIAPLAIFVSLPIAGLFYAPMFMVLTWLQPELAFLVMFVEAPFAWDVGGGPVNMALSDISLMLAVPVLLLRMAIYRKRLPNQPLKWPIIAYFFVCIFSTLANGALASSLPSMLQMVLYLGFAIFVFGNFSEHSNRMITVLHAFVFVNVLLAISLIATGNRYVFDLHKNLVGSELCYAVIIGVELISLRLKRKERILILLPAVALVIAGLVFSVSRGAWIGACAGLGAVFLIRREFKIFLGAMVFMVVAIIAAWSLISDDTKDYAVNFDSSAYSIGARYNSVEYAEKFFLSNPIFGAGVGLRKDYDATNVILSTLAETGVCGLIALLSIFVVLFTMVRRAANQISSDDPRFSLLAVGAALCTAHFVHGCVDHYWSRGTLPVWASVGMAVCVYRSTRIKAPMRKGRRT